MKKLFLLFAACVGLAGCSTAQVVEVDIHNPSAAARKAETVEIDWNEIAQRLDGVTPDNIVVLDAAQKQVASQVVYEGTDTPRRLIFQTALPGAGAASYTLQKGVREEYAVQAYGRFVPERADDYAWENNVMAFRVYGPSLGDPKTPGMDVWAKSTERMVIDDWYAGKDYHTNHGEGMDAYKVGNTLGGGAAAPLVDGKLWLSGNYTRWQRLDNGPIRTTVKLTYAPFTVGDREIALEKVISLDANTHFNRITETYTGDFETLPVAAGVVLHGVKERFTGPDYIGIYEAMSDSKQPEIDGDLALGIILPGAERTDTIENHLAAVCQVRPGEPMHYWSGAGWSQAGVTDAGLWQAILLQQAEQLENPAVVTFK